MGTFKNLDGLRFGRLTVLHRGENKKGVVHWVTKCDCGNTSAVSAGNLSHGRQISCGCHRKEASIAACKARTIHGHASGEKSPTYRTWVGMIQRCTDPNATAWARYGAIGISVCERWLSGERGLTAFECFLADMGPKPSEKHSIDRIIWSGNYEPGNCRWATMATQANNKRTSKLNDEQVDAIRLARSRGVSCEHLASQFGIHRAYVGQVAKHLRRAIRSSV